MNKIQQLVEKAKENVPHGLSPEKWLEVYHKNFAELIVQECAGIVESQDVDPSFKHRMSWAIKKHFGVEV